MSLSLIVFIASGAGIVLLVGLKMLQERLGLLLFWPDSREKLELRLKRYVGRIEECSRTCNKRTVYILAHYILVRIRSLFVFLQQKIDKRLVHLVNLIKGKKMIEMKGTASHFLHDIHRFKDKFRKR